MNFGCKATIYQLLNLSAALMEAAFSTDMRRGG